MLSVGQKPEEMVVERNRKTFGHSALIWIHVDVTCLNHCFRPSKNANVLPQLFSDQKLCEVHFPASKIWQKLWDFRSHQTPGFITGFHRHLCEVFLSTVGCCSDEERGEGSAPHQPQCRVEVRMPPRCMSIGRHYHRYHTWNILEWHCYMDSYYIHYISLHILIIII